MAVVNRIALFQAELAAWRQELHRHPETAFEEARTAAFVAERLRGFGLDEVHGGIGGTGVVGVLRAGSGRGTIALRADMDALPITEETGVPYASQVPGRMHACGHDGHTVMLLGAARYLAETRRFDGTVYLVFQPAEESGGGARVMLEEGLFERFPPDRVFALHNWPGLPLGSFAFHDGPVMAATDRFAIHLQGKGGHAAMPHQGRDPLLAAAQLVQAAQGIVARNVDPVDSAVVSITRLHAGEAYNVIPDSAELSGTTRSFRAETRDLLERRLGEVVRGVALAAGIEATLDYQRGYPPTVNHAAETGLAASCAAEIVGESRVARGALPSMAAEDFAYMLEQRPGCYAWMGVDDPTRPAAALHSPHYDFNDEAIPIGASWLARLAERLLPAG
jgi:amidohydrolase